MPLDDGSIEFDLQDRINRENPLPQDELPTVTNPWQAAKRTYDETKNTAKIIYALSNNDYSNNPFQSPGGYRSSLLKQNQAYKQSYSEEGTGLKILDNTAVLGAALFLPGGAEAKLGEEAVTAAGEKAVQKAGEVVAKDVEQKIPDEAAQKASNEVEAASIKSVNREGTPMGDEAKDSLGEPVPENTSSKEPTVFDKFRQSRIGGGVMFGFSPRNLIFAAATGIPDSVFNAIGPDDKGKLSINGTRFIADELTQTASGGVLGTGLHIGFGHISSRIATKALAEHESKLNEPKAPEAASETVSEVTKPVSKEPKIKAGKSDISSAIERRFPGINKALDNEESLNPNSNLSSIFNLNPETTKLLEEYQSQEQVGPREEALNKLVKSVSKHGIGYVDSEGVGGTYDVFSPKGFEVLNHLEKSLKAHDMMSGSEQVLLHERMESIKNKMGQKDLRKVSKIEGIRFNKTPHTISEKGAGNDVQYKSFRNEIGSNEVGVAEDLNSLGDSKLADEYRKLYHHNLSKHIQSNNIKSLYSTVKDIRKAVGDNHSDLHVLNENFTGKNSSKVADDLRKWVGENPALKRSSKNINDSYGKLIHSLNNKEGQNYIHCLLRNS